MWSKEWWQNCKWSRCWQEWVSLDDISLHALWWVETYVCRYLRSGVYSLILHRQLWNILWRLCHQLTMGHHSSSLCRGAWNKLGALSTSKCFIGLGSSSNINRELLPNNVRRKFTTLDKLYCVPNFRVIRASLIELAPNLHDLALVRASEEINIGFVKDHLSKH